MTRLWHCGFGLLLVWLLAQLPFLPVAAAADPGAGDGEPSAQTEPPAQVEPPAQTAPPAPTTLHVGESEVVIAFGSGEFEVGRERIVAWIANSAEVVRGYYGRFPVPRVRVFVEARRGGGVRSGSTYGPGEPRIRIAVGAGVSDGQLKRDWVMIHEMTHLAFPWMTGHEWLEEGIATYVEPIARGQAGQMTETEVWQDLFGGMPQGLPRDGDRGLDRTPTWGRTYWGGALFCFEADVEIRRRTENRHGLQDALRGVLASGGSIAVQWPIERSLKAADDAVGVPVLTELYEKMRAEPVAPDLDALGKQLGMALRSGRVELDDAAPLAKLRRAITASRAPAQLLSDGAPPLDD